MSRQERIDLLQKLEDIRGSRIVSLILGDRPGLETRIAPDLLPLVSRQLRLIGRQDRIDVFLYSTGGDIMTGYRLVRLLREYCKSLSVLVPFKCQSTGTLIALGADEIVMLPEGQLSPVDPSITGPYNPAIPGAAFQPGMPLPVLPVSVEEVMSYVLLAKEVGVQGESGLLAVFERLTNDIRPLALGQVFRARTQIRILSRNLLQSHMKSANEERIEEIVKTLTEKLYSHDYLIDRGEAKSYGLSITDADGDTESVMAQLMAVYETDLDFFSPFNPISLMSAASTVRITLERAYVESTDRVDAFVTDRTLTTAGGVLGDHVHFEGWKEP